MHDHEHSVTNLLERIEAIEDHSHRIAKEVALTPSTRHNHLVTAQTLRSELAWTIARLEAEGVNVDEALGLRLSEIRLDLRYLQSPEAPDTATSLRLGRIIMQRNAERAQRQA